MPDSVDHRSAAIVAALEVARTGSGRGDLAALLAGIELHQGPNAPREEVWLAGELAYRAGQYRTADAVFDTFERRSDVSGAPPWERYLSAHRRSFSAFQIGRAREAEAHIDRAAALIAGSDDLRPRVADVTAMRAHLAELRADFDTAWELFERAFAEATAAGNVERARTVASDLGRLAAIAHRISDGLHWLRTARGLPGAARPLVSATIRLREGILFSLSDLHDEALAAFADAASAADGLPAEIVVDAMARRGNVLAEIGRDAEAETFLREAARVAREHGLQRHELYCHKDLAMVLASRGATVEGATEFREAVRVTLSLKPPPPLALRQLLEDILEIPALAGRNAWTTTRRDQLTGIVGKLGKAERPGAYQRATSRAVGARGAVEAAVELGRLLADRVELATCSVDFDAMTVATSARRTRLTATDATVLRALLGAPTGLTTARIALELSKSVPSTEQALSRLRRKLGRSLSTQRGGRKPAVHRLLLAPRPERGPLPH